MRWEFERLLVRGKENFGKAFSILFDDLKGAAKELFFQIPHDIKYFLRNLWFYKSFLWADRDWDYAWILRGLQAKIRKTRVCIEKHGSHANVKKDVKSMKKAEELIDAILNDKVISDLSEIHDKKWGKPKIVFVKMSGGYSVMRTVRAGVDTPDQYEQERKEHRELINKIGKLEDKQWKKLWVHLEKHMQAWWD